MSSHWQPSILPWGLYLLYSQVNHPTPHRALITHPAVYLIVLYSLLCVLPLAWTVGVLPPLEALVSWGLEQAHTRLLGGSPAATDLRYVYYWGCSCCWSKIMSNFVAAIILSFFGLRPWAIYYPRYGQIGICQYELWRHQFWKVSF